jgi:hypothetical protein
MTSDRESPKPPSGGFFRVRETSLFSLRFRGTKQPLSLFTSMQPASMHRSKLFRIAEQSLTLHSAYEYDGANFH